MESIVKYMKTRGYDCTEFYELFHKLDYYLRVHSDGMNKRITLYNILDEIGRKLSKPITNPIERLKDIYEDIRYAYYNLNKENMTMILDSFNDILALRPSIEKIGGTVYNYYSQLVQQVGKCDAILLHVANLDNPRVLPKDLLNGLRNEFSSLFSAIQKVITPPVKIGINREQIMKLVDSGVPMNEISGATGYSEDALRFMLTQATMEGEE